LLVGLGSLTFLGILGELGLQVLLLAGESLQFGLQLFSVPLTIPMLLAGFNQLLRSLLNVGAGLLQRPATPL
jgi:hypothetical protein